MAVAVVDSYQAAVGSTVSGSPWQNDTYNASWSEDECVDSQWHDAYTEQPVWFDTSHFDDDGNWIEDGYYDPPEPVYHPAWYECLEYASVSHYATGSMSGDGLTTTGGDGSGEELAFTYTPPSNFEGTVSFGYSISDNDGSDSGTVNITFGHVPNAADDDFDTTVGAGITGSLNVSDDDGDQVTTTLDTDATNGSATVSPDGTFAYTPNPGFAGPDSFTYAANDGLATSIGTIRIRVSHPPLAVDDAYTATEDTPLVIAAAAGLLANDSDDDGDSLTAVPLTNPTNGTITLAADGSFTYTPAANFHGTDSFTYAASDGVGTATATVTITVTSVNDPPLAGSASFTTAAGTALTISAASLLGLASDPENDPLTIGPGSGPAHGTVTTNGNGDFVYTANAGFHGQDSFSFAVSDGQAATDGLVSLTVYDPGRLPAAQWDSYSTASGQALAISAPGVLANDSDPDNLPLTAVRVTGTGHGGLTLNADGRFTYTPSAGFSGWDYFTYRAYNGYVYSPEATVWIKVGSPPVAAADSYTMVEDGLLNSSFSVLANDTDPDQDLLTATLLIEPTHGTLVLTPYGNFSYRPQPGFTGDDTFQYVASDEQASSNAAIVTIHVLPAGATLVAADDDYTTFAGMGMYPAAPGVMANDNLPAGTSVTSYLVTPAAHANSQVLWEDGSFSYRPELGYVGPDSFTYQLTDGQAVSNVATVSLNMLPVNDIALTAFYPDGTDLSVEYFVTGDQVGPFNITVSAITDGQTPALPLEVWPGDTSPGLHTLRIAPTFVDPQSDYSLVAQVDSGDSVIENSEDNNTAPLQPGAFVVHETAAGGSGQTVLHVEGSDAADPVAFACTGFNRWQILMPRSAAAVPSSGSPPSYYDVTGNGLVNALDSAAVQNILSGQAITWQRPGNRFDVTYDAYVSPADALVIINALSATGERILTGSPGPSDNYLDVSGDGVLSIVDANQVIDYLNGNDGTAGAAWRNPSQPLDVNGDGTVNLADQQAIQSYLALGEIDYTALALDQIHIRTHAGNDVVAADGAIAWLFGGWGSDTLTGGSFDDLIVGGMDGDSLSGGDGNDTLIGAAGADALEGGDGIDTVDYSDSVGGVTVNLNAGYNGIGGDAEGDSFVVSDGDVSIENVIGSAYADVLTGNDLANTIDGGTGDDTISGAGGDDYINVADGDSTIDGGDGNNTIFAGNGNNTITAGSGDDTISVGDGDNTVNANDGNDAITAGGGQNTIDGGNGDDYIFTSGTDNNIDSGSGDNSVYNGDTSEGGDRNLLVNIDWHRVADIGKDDGNDERDVIVTLEGLDGFSMSEVLSIYGRGHTGIQSIQFFLSDPDTDYTLTVAVSDGLTGGGSMTFNASSITYAANGTYDVTYEVLSTGVNYDENGELPEGYELPNPDPNPISAGDNEYTTVEAGELDVDADSGVLSDDIDGDHAAVGYDTASLAQQALHGVVTLLSDGSFSYIPTTGFSGLDFFRYTVSGAFGASLMATAYLQVKGYSPADIKVEQTAQVTEAAVGAQETNPEFAAKLQDYLSGEFKGEYEKATFNFVRDLNVTNVAGLSGVAIFWTKAYSNNPDSPYDLSGVKLKIVPFSVVMDETAKNLIKFPGTEIKPVAGPKDTAAHEKWHTDGANIGLPPNTDKYRFEGRPGYRQGALLAKSRFNQALRLYVDSAAPDANVFHTKVDGLLNEIFLSTPDGVQFSFMKYGN